jgi:hypothetical protein
MSREQSNTPAKAGKRFPWVLYLITLFLIMAVALAPVASVMACAWIANAHGCKVDEGSVHPCMIDGKDYGSLLYSLGVMGWLMIVTIPVGALAFLAWLIMLILHRTNWRRQTLNISS